MDFDDPIQRRVFFEVHRDLPREGPGNRSSTLEALQRVHDAPGAVTPLRVLDVACGPGMQTLDVALNLPQAHVVAVDLHAPFLRELGRRTAAAGVAERVSPIVADMHRLPLADGALDLVWCEGAAYIMGVEQALEAWRRLLRPGGACAFTEAVWLRDDPPAAVRACWEEYPDMGGVEDCRELIQRHGYDLLGDFVLPAAAWWDDYYGPMEARLAALDARYRGDPAAAGVLADCRAEIDIYRRFGDWYGYAFFVARKPRGEDPCRVER
jgi:SAM-dependent methyltransferase